MNRFFLKLFLLLIAKHFQLTAQNERQLESLELKRLFYNNKITSYNDSLRFIEEKINLIKNQHLLSKIDTNGIVRLKGGAKLRLNPDPLSIIIVTFNEGVEAKVIDYSQGYFGVCIQEQCGYINDIWMIKDSVSEELIKNFILRENYLEAERKKILEKINQKNLEKQIQHFIKKYGKSTYEKLEKGVVWIGMSREMLLLSRGNPEKINRTVGSWGIHEQFVYGNGFYVYVKNGIVESFQD